MILNGVGNTLSTSLVAQKIILPQAQSWQFPFHLMKSSDLDYETNVLLINNMDNDKTGESAEFKGSWNEYLQYKNAF